MLARRSKSTLTLALTLGALIVLGGCTRDRTDHLVARVNGIPITKEDFARMTDWARSAQGLDDPETLPDGFMTKLERKTLGRLIEATIYRSKFDALGLRLEDGDVEEVVSAQLAGESPLGDLAALRPYVRRLAEERLVRSKVEAASLESVRPKEEDLRRFYSENMHRFRDPASAQVKQISIKLAAGEKKQTKARETMANDLAVIARAQGFEAAAKAAQKAPYTGVTQYQDLGWVTAKHVPRLSGMIFFSEDPAVPVWAAVQEKGKLLGPTKTDVTIEILWVEDSRMGVQHGFEAVRDEVVASLQSLERARGAQALKDALWSEAKIEEFVDYGILESLGRKSADAG